MVDVYLFYLKEIQLKEEEEEDDDVVFLSADKIRKPEDKSAKSKKGVCTMCVIRNII